ncbi:MAG TPA: M48 family metalloprotease [Gammaproteobacteria bacterium]|nr:M48 family metalloprotease [Gammaproteobacteria bacterium]
MPRIAASVALFLICGTAAAQGTNLPDFGSPVDSVINKNQEQQLGRAVLAQLRAAGAIVEDAQLKEYVQALGSRLVGHANDGTQSFEFFIVDDAAINAFALPGGFIGVNSGLILASDSESELAGVLAHEIAHVTQRHIARSIYDSQRTSMLSMATMLAAILLGAATDASGDAVTGLVTAGQAATMQRQINFTRANEHEADRVGIETLSSAGFDASGMASFFEKLARRYGLASQQIPAILQTHPVTTERIAEARSRTRLVPAVTHVDSTGYALAKARLTIRQARTPEAARAVFTSRAESGVGDAANDYGLALTYLEAGLVDEAERLFTQLVTAHPGVIAFWIGRGETLMKSGLVDAALQVYVEAAGLFPRNVPLTISQAEALINAGQPARAHKILLDLFNNVQPTPEQIRLIARAANAEGDIGNSHYYMGEYYVSIRNLPLAIGQLQMALESPGVNAVDRSRYRARLDQIAEAMPEEMRRRMDDAGGDRPPRPVPTR